MQILLGWQKATEQLEWIRPLAQATADFMVPEWSADQNHYDADAGQLMRLAPHADIIVGWNFSARGTQSGGKDEDAFFGTYRH